MIAETRRLSPGLEHALDTVGSDMSPAIVSQALADRGGNLCGIRPGKAQVANIAPRANITDVSAWRAFLQDHLLKDISFAVSLSTKHGLARDLADFHLAFSQRSRISCSPFPQSPKMVTRWYNKA